MYKTVTNHYPSTRKHFYMPKQNKQQKNSTHFLPMRNITLWTYVHCVKFQHLNHYAAAVLSKSHHWIPKITNKNWLIIRRTVIALMRRGWVQTTLHSDPSPRDIKSSSMNCGTCQQHPFTSLCVASVCCNGHCWWIGPTWGSPAGEAATVLWVRLPANHYLATLLLLLPDSPRPGTYPTTVTTWTYCYNAQTHIYLKKCSLECSTAKKL